MNAAEIRQALKGWREKFRRTAWIPVTESADGGSDSQQGNSWFGGRPRVTEGDWPSCTECSKPMTFFVQLDLSELPAEYDLPVKSGLLQLFYCDSDDGMCETWQPFSGTQMARIVSLEAEPVSIPDGVSLLPLKAILGWEEEEDFPSTAEQDVLGLEIDYDLGNQKADIRCPEFDVHLTGLGFNVEAEDPEQGEIDIAEAVTEARAGDKLGGWPHWVQGVEYPLCPTCGSPMELVLQIDSEDNLDYMFGDVGCAHLTQCREHPEQLGFGWACC